MCGESATADEILDKQLIVQYNIFIFSYFREGYQIMNNMDLLFHDFLQYVSKWKSGETPDKNLYFTHKIYHCLWVHFIDLFSDGVCPSVMLAALEYEKSRLMNHELTDDEILEVVLLEKILYSFHTGDDATIAELAQKFTSQQFQTKYALLLAEFAKKDCEADNSASSAKADLFYQNDLGAKNLKEHYLLECFLDIRMVVHTFLELEKIRLVCQMLKDNMPYKAIKKYTDTNDKYLDIVSRSIDENIGIIYHELIQNECVSYQRDHNVDYEHLDFNETQILQILKHYFKV